MSGPVEPESPTPLGVRRWMAAVADAADDFAILWRLRHGTEPDWVPVLRGVRERGEPTTRGMLAVNGNDLIAIGFAPGPQLGLVLDRLLALVVDDPALNVRDTLLARARILA